METTGRALIDHWSWAAEKGVMNRNTAAGLRAACVQVLGVLEDPDEVDVTTLNIEDLLTRFQNLRKQRFKPLVLETYKRRFRSALKSYRDYLENPGAWKPASQDRSTNVDRRKRNRNTDAPVQSAGLVTGTGRIVGSEEYRFPVRPGLIARLILPVDLTRDEARRIKAFVDMLVVEESRGDMSSEGQD